MDTDKQKRGDDLERSWDEEGVAPSSGATTGIGLAIMFSRGKGRFLEMPSKPLSVHPAGINPHGQGSE